MTRIHDSNDLVAMCEHIIVTAAEYSSGTIEQNLTYACEEFVTLTWPHAELSEDDVRATIDAIAMAEGWDPPAVFFGNSSSRCEAYVQLESRSVKFNRRHVQLSTVLHELAHLVAASAVHGSRFRTELCALTRSHWGVEQASLLHSLYRGVGLDVDPWQATRRQH